MKTSKFYYFLNLGVNYFKFWFLARRFILEAYILFLYLILLLNMLKYKTFYAIFMKIPFLFCQLILKC